MLLEAKFPICPVAASTFITNELLPILHTTHSLLFERSTMCASPSKSVIHDTATPTQLRVLNNSTRVLELAWAMPPPCPFIVSAQTGKYEVKYRILANGDSTFNPFQFQVKI